MLYLDSEDSAKPIYLYINSPGGSVTAGLAIFDTMKYVKSDVVTICVGLAASMGAFLLSAGTKGKRLALPHSRIMIHQPLGGTSQRQASDIEIEAKEILRIKEMLNRSLADMTGQSFEKIERKERKLSKSLLDSIKNFPKKSHPMDVARTAVSIMGLEDKETKDNSPKANMRKVMRIFAKTPTALAAFYRLRKGKKNNKP